MNTRTRTRRLLASTLGLALLPAFGLSAALVTPAVASAAEAETAKCQVHSVLALKTGDGSIPDDLKFLADQLSADQFAAYKSFRLLETKQFKLELNKPAVAAMKSGHKLTLEFLGSEPETKKLRLRANLTSRTGEGSLVDTRLQFPSGGLLWVGGVRHDDGKLFFAIHCVQGEATKP
ncbi:MAG: hypothetical protein H6713_26270 [Myxococcales bacterium]|nr:hypothetical protein [Myxococcales bacterium]MCB9753463.1 hypothetical protein [Myxococcales bacterium]